jgi:SPP1 family phage portal protein
MSYGRRVIYSDATEITAENVADEVRKAVAVHEANRAEIEKLYGYYRGKTAILGKTKEVRENVNHKICENHAHEVTRFYEGYIFGEPIQYVRRENTSAKKADDKIAADINALNGYNADAGKAACDGKLAKWILVASAGYRMTLPNKAWSLDADEPPFKKYSLDPRQTFIVRTNDVEHRPLMGVNYVKQTETNETVYSVYTDKFLFVVREFGGVEAYPHVLGMIPIIEYTLDESRLGIFEVAMPLLDALDELQSNRMDDIVQFVNSFLAILGGELDEETYKKLNEWKTLCLPEGVDAKYLSPAMNQNDVQTLKEDLYQAVLTICGVPNRNGGSSTSDTGVATIVRDGWSAAEGRAKTIETSFKEAERESLKLDLRILRDTVGTNLRLSDIDIHFTRRNYENIASKAQVLVAMLNNPKIHPELAFQHCGMFADPESAYLQSKEYYEEQMEKWEAVEVDESEGGEDVRVS